MRIFLSHASPSKPFVREFRSFLPPFLNTWLDEDSLEWGSLIQEKLENAIRAEIDVVVIFLDEAASASEWVIKELRWAFDEERRQHRKIILPIVFPKTDIQQLVPDLDKRLFLRLKDFTRSSVQTLANEATIKLFQIVCENYAVARSAGSRSTEISSSFPSEFKERIRTATTILQVGVHLRTDLTAFHEEYTQVLKNGGKIRFLVCKPGGHAIEMASMRFKGKYEPKHEIERLNSSLDTIRQLVESYPKQAKLRAIDFLWGYSALLVNEAFDDGEVYVERYTFQTHGGTQKPKSAYRKGSQWYELISSELTALWNAATSPKPPSSPTKKRLTKGKSGR